MGHWIKSLKFFRFSHMTAGAIPGSHNGGNQGTIMLKTVSIPFLGLMTFETADTRLSVSAILPVTDDTGVFLKMAIDALLGGFWNNNGGLDETSFYPFSGDLHPLD